jgi:hypothetical protein
VRDKSLRRTGIEGPGKPRLSELPRHEALCGGLIDAWDPRFDWPNGRNAHRCLNVDQCIYASAPIVSPVPALWHG